jgi:UDP-2,3-diacylglucosamine pyrophosphatase LpxH
MSQFATDQPEKRSVDLVVLSDVHLGTYGCHAKELIQYLRSIQPKRLVLNGDIIDIWQFSKKYFPKPHMKVIRELVKIAASGIPVHYITGNHDEMLRKFAGFRLGELRIENKLILNLNGRKAWIFHGDVFDVTMQHARWLTRLGSIGYDLLILLNSSVNYCLEKLGREKISLSKRIKNSVKSAVKFINRFEDTCAGIAIENKYDYVVCGHIHQPEIRHMETDEGQVLYLNSGDWVENLTALEYHEGEWNLYKHRQNTREFEIPESEGVNDSMLLDEKALFAMLVTEIQHHPEEIVSHT